MKKIVALLICLVAALSVLLLVSCAKDNNDGEKDSSASYVNGDAENEGLATDDKNDNSQTSKEISSGNASTGNASEDKTSSKVSNTSSTADKDNDIYINMEEFEEDENTSSAVSSETDSASSNSSSKNTSSEKKNSSKTSSKGFEMESTDGWTNDYIIP